MRIVHWNLHHGGVNSLGRLDITTITAWLVKFAPDVVSLAELEQNDGYGNLDQLEHHRAALEAAQGVPWFGNFCALNGNSHGGNGVGLLSKHPPTVVDRKDLGGRPALCVGQQPAMMLYGTHPDPTSPQKRNAELAQLLLWIQAHPPAPATVVCGDFNAVPGSVEMAPWPVLYLDAWTEAKKLGTATSFTVDGATRHSRIDYVWYHGLTVKACDVPDTSAAGVFPSDHHPVVADFA